MTGQEQAQEPSTPTMAELLGEPDMPDEGQVEAPAEPAEPDPEDSGVAEEEPAKNDEAATEEEKEEKEEAPAEEPEPEKEEDPQAAMTAAKFAALARRERKLREREDALKAELAEVEKFKALRDNANLNPQEALSALGLTFDELVAYHADGGKVSADARVAALEKRIQRYEEQEKARQESEAKSREQADFDQTMQQYDAYVNQLIGKSPSRYGVVPEFARKINYPLHKLVLDTTVQVADERGVHPSTVSIEDSLDSIANFINNLNSGGEASSPPPEPQGQGAVQARPEVTKARPKKTLTNDAGGVPAKPVRLDDLPADEAWETILRQAKNRVG